MRASLRALLLFVGLMLVQVASTQQPKNITEPNTVTLESLFKQADKVAIVKIVSGDAENYDIAIYKGEVIETFKGATVGDTVFFGPYVGERLGWEYILFLRDVSQSVVPKVPNASYGTVHYAEVFNEGYSSMMTSYECVFDGKEISRQCDYGVRVCTDYILLPASIPTFPPTEEDTAFGCRWVRKLDFVSLLRTLAKSKK